MRAAVGFMLSRRVSPNSTACADVLDRWCEKHCELGREVGPETLMVAQQGYGNPKAPWSNPSAFVWRCYARDSPTHFCTRPVELELLHSEAIQCQQNASLHHNDAPSASSANHGEAGSSPSESAACRRALNSWCMHRARCNFGSSVVARRDYGHPRQPSGDVLEWRCYARATMHRGQYLRQNASRDGVGDYCTRPLLAVLRDGLSECVRTREARHLLRAERQYMLKRADAEKAAKKHWSSKRTFTRGHRQWPLKSGCTDPAHDIGGRLGPMHLHDCVEQCARRPVCGAVAFYDLMDNQFQEVSESFISMFPQQAIARFGFCQHKKTACVQRAEFGACPNRGCGDRGWCAFALRDQPRCPRADDVRGLYFLPLWSAEMHFSMLESIKTKSNEAEAAKNKGRLVSFSRAVLFSDAREFELTGGINNMLMNVAQLLEHSCAAGTVLVMPHLDADPVWYSDWHGPTQVY